MAQTKEIYIEAKRSKDFQTYTVGILAEVGKYEDTESVARELQAKCRKLANEQIQIDKCVK